MKDLIHYIPEFPKLIGTLSIKSYKKFYGEGNGCFSFKGKISGENKLKQKGKIKGCINFNLESSNELLLNRMFTYEVNTRLKFDLKINSEIKIGKQLLLGKSESFLLKPTIVINSKHHQCLEKTNDLTFIYSYLDLILPELSILVTSECLKNTPIELRIFEKKNNNWISFDLYYNNISFLYFNLKPYPKRTITCRDTYNRVINKLRKHCKLNPVNIK